MADRHRCGAERGRCHAELRVGDGGVLAVERETARVQRLVDAIGDPFARQRHPVADHDQRWIEHVDEVGDPDAEPMSRVREQLAHPGHVLFGRRQQRVQAGRWLVAQPELIRLKQQRLLRGERLPAAAVAAAAAGPVLREHHMPDFAGEPGYTAVQRVVQYDAGADPDADADIEQVRDGATGAEFFFPERPGVSFVIDGHLQAEFRLQHVAQRHVLPAEVRGGQHPP